MTKFTKYPRERRGVDDRWFPDQRLARINVRIGETVETWRNGSHFQILEWVG